MTALVLPEGQWWDWEIMTWTAGTLTLAASTDLTYHHGLEVIVSDVGFVQCPSLFHHAVFREPTAAERDFVLRQSAGDAPLIVAFDHNEHDAAGRAMSGLIGAADVRVVTGTAYRYLRPGLRPGERLASEVIGGGGNE
ncbi:hypothetical protein [Winogradskya humida]|uniref:Uncharacterized protein n=1 Tax=Winogradskya humida TaxID=113566 RepID=A0ABQ3ZHT6_9ACTN|nr:hypothetical protein [Actinoplanes humidus]GIE18102.1 hypothetical protein Ahu01nite_012040 [Actinoplanes humidus]